MRESTETSTAARVAAFAYGAVAYVTFFATFCYAIGFVTNLMVPKSIDTGTPGTFWPSVGINIALLGLFGLQHTIMARPEFKEVWTKIVPKPIERSTFVLATNAVFLALFVYWQPMPTVAWHVTNPIGAAALTAIQIGGFVFALLASIMIHHFDLFGMRQVTLFARGERYTELGFRTPGFYKYVRHPLMLGFFIAFWVTPTMTVGHLLFAAVTTAYIVVAVQIEERTLLRFHPVTYANYRREVPAFFPTGRSATPVRQPVTTAAGD